jgi:pyruvate/2-oxoglutarate dehydrogenase complex dihydrolipoamide acyltransferase (E2) component
MTSSEADAAFGDPDSEGCLCVVASYTRAARLISEVTAEAAARIMMSPSLGDFLEFRFVDLGPQPGQSGDRARAVRRVSDELLRSGGGAGRNHFALVVVDRSADSVDQVLSGCATSPFLAALRMRFLGIASFDDRQARDGWPAGDGAFAGIVTSPTGAWRDMNALVEVIRQHGEELMRYFATRREPGLSRDELDSLWTRYTPDAAEPAAPAAPAPLASPAGEDAEDAEDAVPPPDVLAMDAAGPAAEPPETDPSAVAEPPGAQRDVKPDPHPDAAAAEPGPARRPVSRWLPEVRWRRGQRPATDDGDAPAARPRTHGLAYLLITGHENAYDDPAMNRLRSVVIEVDKKLAELPGAAYQVRLLHGSDETLRGDPRPAGQLGRRDVKRSVTGADFAAVLRNLRPIVRRDVAAARAAGQPVRRPAVVLFTPDPPLADTVAVEVYRDFAAEASITWVVPKIAEALVSPEFTRASGHPLSADDEMVADDVAAALGDAGRPVTSASRV